MLSAKQKLETSVELSQKHSLYKQDCVSFLLMSQQIAPDCMSSFPYDPESQKSAVCRNEGASGIVILLGSRGRTLPCLFLSLEILYIYIHPLACGPISFWSVVLWPHFPFILCLSYRNIWINQTISLSQVSWFNCMCKIPFTRILLIGVLSGGQSSAYQRIYITISEGNESLWSPWRNAETRQKGSNPRIASHFSDRVIDPWPRNSGCMPPSQAPIG